jgi:hypothetical protein
MTNLYMRTCNSDGKSYKNFQWPLEVGARVVAPDWIPNNKCGYGLHGFKDGGGAGSLLNWQPNAIWMVVEDDQNTAISLNGKYKMQSCIIRVIGTQKDITQYMYKHGDRSVIINGLIHSCGAGETLIGGMKSQLTGDEFSRLIGGVNSKLSGGYNSTIIGDAGAIIEGGAWSNLAGGAWSNIKGGPYSAIVAKWGSILCGGERSTLQWSYWDSTKQNYVNKTYTVGEDGIEPNIYYRTHNNNRIERINE